MVAAPSAGASAGASRVSCPIPTHLGGFIRVGAESLADVDALLAGNPVFENGGTVEIRELPKTG